MEARAATCARTIAGIAITHARNNVARLSNILHLERTGIEPAFRRPNMRVMETVTGSVLSAATIVLAVGAIFAL